MLNNKSNNSKKGGKTYELHKT